MLNHYISPAEHEIKFAKTFLDKHSFERFSNINSNHKLRKKFINKLSHFKDFNRILSTKISANSQTSDEIFKILTIKFKAVNQCYKISEWSKIDKTFSELNIALSQINGLQMGTILSIFPGKLAYYEGEEKNERYFFYNSKQENILL